MIPQNELQKIFIKSQQTLLDLISNKNNLGLSTHKEKELLKRVQELLNNMVDDCWEKSPNFFERLFKNSKLEKSYRNLDLTYTEQSIVDRITDNFMSNIINASYNVFSNVKNTFKETVSSISREGLFFKRNELFTDLFLKNMSDSGLVAFVDKSGKKWGLQTYSDMVIRTTSRMTTNYGVLYTFEHIDLYKISKHGTTCKICAPLEGRVYSRSGTHPYYPPLASAFGKIDKNGPNDLSNTYLNIHPNCMHVLIPFKEEAYTKKEVEEIRQFSSFETNPPTYDPRSNNQLEKYRKKEDGRTKLLNDFKEFQKMKIILGPKMPKTFQTFQKHKLNNTEVYNNWKNLYKNSL